MSIKAHLTDIARQAVAATDIPAPIAAAEVSALAATLADEADASRGRGVPDNTLLEILTGQARVEAQVRAAVIAGEAVYGPQF